MTAWTLGIFASRWNKVPWSWALQSLSSQDILRSSQRRLPMAGGSTIQPLVQCRRPSLTLSKLEPLKLMQVPQTRIYVSPKNGPIKNPIHWGKKGTLEHNTWLS